MNASRKKRLPGSGSALRSLFQEVKRDAPLSVDVLVDSKVGLVAEIDHADVAVVLDPPVKFRLDCPLLLNGKQLTTHMITEDKLYLDSVESIDVGSMIVQPCRTGRLSEVFQAFQEQWSARWGRHSDIPSSHWDRIVAFGRHRLGKVVASPLALSVPLIRAAARSKRAQAAIGLDGVSRQDVINLPSNAVLSLINLFTLAHETGCWPSQTVQGIIKSLAKTSDPCSTGDFHPITIYSIVYRLWSSLQSRFWIKQLDSILDHHLCGNRGNHSAASLWYHVLQAIELAQCDDDTLCGVNFDLEKAYKMIPRFPVFALGAIAGIHQQVLVAWAGALSSMGRRFQVRGSVGPVIEASCGFPEGCGMSCISMMLIDQIWHEWLKADVAMARPLSFVDNWEVLTTDPMQVAASIDSTLRFADALDLVVDRSKTYCWATTRQARRELGQFGYVVRLNAKDLGAHTTFSKQVRNSTCVTRFRDLEDFWDKLENAAGSFHLKRQVVIAAAWPRALHAIGASFIGAKHFHGLRTSYMKALKLCKPGANAFLQLCLDGVCFDPQLAAIKASLVDFRNLGGGPAQLDVFSIISRNDGNFGMGSVLQVLTHRLHMVGWEVGLEGWVRDELGWFSCRDLHWAELILRLERSWQLVVASQIAHRADFVSFKNVDVAATRKALDSFSSYDQGIVRRLLNGSTTTNQHACHWSLNGTHLCVGCGAPDSLSHRFWSCPVSGKLRASLDKEVLELVPVLPEILTCHAWTLRSSVHDAWCAYLLNLPPGDLSSSFVPWEVSGVVDLFTDGSCLFPEECSFRLAAWSVCLVEPIEVCQTAWKTHVVEAAALCGLVQTAFRAELQAVVYAVGWGLSQGPSITTLRLWIDCQGVLDRMTLVLDGLETPKSTWPNNDLWSELVRLVHQFGRDRLFFAKVAAHVAEEDCDSSLDEWFSIGNSAADRAAKQANVGRSDEVWCLWERHASEVCGNRRLAASIRQHQVAVCRLWTDQFGHLSSKEAPTQPKSARFFAKGFQHAGAEVEVCPPLVKLLGHCFTELLKHWWVDTIDLTIPDTDIEWVSFVHLFVAFQQVTGHPGLIRKGRRWVDPLG